MNLSFQKLPTVEGGIFLPDLAGNLEVQNPIADSKKIWRWKTFSDLNSEKLFFFLNKFLLKKALFHEQKSKRKQNNFFFKL